MLVVSILIAIEMGFATAQPFFIGRILSVIQSSGPSRDGYLYCLGFSLCVLGVTVMHHVSFVFAWQLGYDVRAGTIGMIYQKAMRVSRCARVPWLAVTRTHTMTAMRGRSAR